jgi:hypothetical protein
MTKPQQDHGAAIALGVLSLLLAVYFAFPMLLIKPLWGAYQSNRLTYDRYLAMRNALLFPVDRLADMFPAYDRWAFGPSGRTGI